MLTKRQSEVHALAVQQKSNKEIAAHLNITVRTVKFHMTGILQKFGFTSRTDFIVYGRNGVLSSLDG